MSCNDKTVAAVKLHRSLKQFNPLADVANAKATVYAGCTDTIVPDGQEQFLIVSMQRDDNVLGMAMADCIGDTFLDHSVDGVFLILILRRRDRGG